MPAKPTRKPLSGPRIEITPTPEQYDQLCHDLKALRRSGATTNTAAILDAVRAAAARGKIQRTTTTKRTRGARSRSPVPQQEG